MYEFKYIGVVFNEYISRNSHVKYILSRAGKRLGMLGRIMENLTSHCADSIYTAYIRPIMDYIIVTPCGIAAESVTPRLWRGFKDMPQKLFPKWVTVTKL